METINTPLRTTLVLHCYSRADWIENEQAPAVQEELKSLVASGILEPQQPVPHYKLTPRGLDFVKTLLATPFPAPEEPASECKRCKGRGTVWNSAVEPAGGMAICPECETQDGATMKEWYGGFAKIERTEPVPDRIKSLAEDVLKHHKPDEPVAVNSEPTNPVVDQKTQNLSDNDWRELGPDEEIHTGDQVQAKHHDKVYGVWLEVFPYEIGAMPIDHEAFRYRTRRPLPKQEEMPLDVIEESLKWIEGDGKYALDHDEMFGEVCNCIRYLRDEIQKLKQK
jgi:hypothetical protein